MYQREVFQLLFVTHVVLGTHGCRGYPLSIEDRTEPFRLQLR